MKTMYVAGGMGDIWFAIHTSRIIETLREEPDSRIFVNSSNPSSVKIFDAINACRNRVVTCKAPPACEVYTPPLRDLYEPHDFGNGFENVLPKRYILVSPYSNARQKDFNHIMWDAVQTHLCFGGYQLGANYPGHEETQCPLFEQTLFDAHPLNIYNTIRDCTGVITCHSMANMLAWFHKKPQLICLDQTHFVTAVDPILRRDPNHFGFGHPKTRWISNQASASAFDETVRNFIKSL